MLGKRSSEKLIIRISLRGMINNEVKNLATGFLAFPQNVRFKLADLADIASQRTSCSKCSKGRRLAS